MQTAPHHLSTADLERGLPDVLSSPQDEGQLVAIVVRPATDERRVVATAQASPVGGIDGDRWIHESPADPRGQVSLMNSRFLRQIAGHEDAVSLAGDNLIVDLDLSEDNLPPGSRVAIGKNVVVEINGEPHTGCGKFQKRYGANARTFMNNARGTQLHLRGRYGSIVAGGAIAVGDAVRKLAPA
ncbi:MAG: MOSC domain-containing protein [Pirellulales bacterium]